MIVSTAVHAETSPKGATENVRTVAITFDDLPFASGDDTIKLGGDTATALSIDRRIRKALKRKRVPATGFVNESRVKSLGSEGHVILAAWNRGLLSLGNHGATHADSNMLTLNEIDQEIISGEATIRPLTRDAGRSIPFFRFPYNHVGNTDERRVAIEGLLQVRNYRIAASTIDTSDYLFDQAYRRALLRKDDALKKRIATAYLEHTRHQIQYYGDLNRKVVGYEPPEVMLLHFNMLNAVVMDQLLDLFAHAGYRFVSLSEAQDDPVYRHPPTFSTKFGPMWGYRWARERSIKVDGRLEQEPPAWITAYAESGQASSAEGQ